MSSLIHIGIDVSKSHLDVANSASSKLVRLTNDQAGFKKLRQMFPDPQQVQIVVESTGIYHLEMALDLAENQYQVAVVMPGRVCGMGIGRMPALGSDGRDMLGMPPRFGR